VVAKPHDSDLDALCATVVHLPELTLVASELPKKRGG